METKKKTEHSDQDEININEEYEVQYWASRFKISQNQLKETVHYVGSYKEDVEQYLNQHIQSSS